jgi:hypothetical protein
MVAANARFDPGFGNLVNMISFACSSVSHYYFRKFTITTIDGAKNKHKKETSYPDAKYWAPLTRRSNLSPLPIGGQSVLSASGESDHERKRHLMCGRS